MKKGTHLSSEAKKKLRDAAILRWSDPIFREKMIGCREYPTGKNHPNYKSVIVTCDFCGSDIEKQPNEIGEHNYCNMECLGNWRHEHWIGEDHPQFGATRSEDACKNMSDNCRPMTGANNPAWKGGVTPQDTLFRNSAEYAEWRTAVFQRDNFTCQECDQWGGNLNAHHILPYRDWKEPKFSLNIANGITLCKDCHRLVKNKEYEVFSKYFDIANGVGKYGRS